jgi:hypothetical protein
MRVGAQLSESMVGEYIVKAATKGELLIPRTLHNAGDNPVLCFIKEINQMFRNFPFSILWTPLFRNFYLLYSDSLYVRTQLGPIVQLNKESGVPH